MRDLLLPLILLLAGCANEPSMERLQLPCSVQEVAHVMGRSPAGKAAQLQVLDSSGQVIPFALLALEESHWGRMMFQCDENGVLDVAFNKKLVASDATLSAGTIPIKTRLLDQLIEESYASLQGATLVVRPNISPL